MPIIDQYFEKLIELGGSDLHLSQGQPAKVRVHGSIQPIEDKPLTAAGMETMMREICEPRAWERYQEKGDLDFAYEMNADSRFRCNYLRQQWGFGAVFRIIPTKIASLEQLGIPPVVKNFGHMRSGLVLVTGPTG
ncbi:MAG: type IV pili twitching motility protein PilT, partial [Verrucomicrobiales bacterium]|nr:type IV pili twitching motility protein PilT [Verrucomicrobiales bacterium]